MNCNYKDNQNVTPVYADDLAVNPTAQEPNVDADELAVAEKEATTSGYIYKHAFKKPVSYENLTVKEMTFDWNKLTGKDGLDIENEMQALGKMVIVPSFSGEYLIRMATRACSPRVGSDFFERIPLSDYNKIRSAARSFLLKSE